MNIYDEVSMFFFYNFKNKSYDIFMSMLSELLEMYICWYYFENILEGVLIFNDYYKYWNICICSVIWYI